MKWVVHLASAFVLNAIALGSLWAQNPIGRTIYTCTDASGVRITSDRLIAQCMDREQRVLGSSGVERQRIGPAMTEAEMAQHQEARRQQQREKDRLKEQRRHEQSLLARYPDRTVHDAQRQQSLQPAQALLGLSQQRLLELQQHERELQQELEFYAKDVSQAPAQLKARLQDVRRAISAQQVQIASRETDIYRIHLRFEEELQQLKILWRQLEVSKE